MGTNRQLCFMEQMPFFGVLSLDEQLSLSHHAQILHFSMGQTIYEKEAVSEFLYCIVSGEVRMNDEQFDGLESSLGLLKGGDSFGLEGRLEETRNLVTYSAAGDVRLLAIDIEMFCDVLSQNSELKQLVANSMSSQAVAMFLKRTVRLPTDDQQAVRTFLERMTVIKAEKGQAIVRQGEDSDAFYFVHTGQCGVLKEGEGTIINRLIPGDFFGELALLTEERRKATVIATEESQLLRLSKDDFNQMIVEYTALKSVRAH